MAGLAGTTYLDKVDNWARKRQDGEVTISTVTDRIYLGVPFRQVLHTSAGRMTVESEATCAVIWNAWTNDKAIADLGEGDHGGYLCVERCDVADPAAGGMLLAADDAVLLKASAMDSAHLQAQLLPEGIGL